MIQAAPLVLSFARAVPMLNKLVGAVGITELGNRVNNYIQENPDESAKIVSMIMPTQGIANALKNKSSEDVEEVQESEIFMNKEKISLEDLDEMTDEEAADLPDEDKAELMKQAGKKRDRELSIATSEKLGLSGPGKEKIDIEREIDERVDPGGIQKEKKGYDFRDYIPKGAYKKRYADGGAIGIEVLFEEKKPRKNFFMGGPALEGQALNIYNSMNSYGFSDQEIANALQGQGLYTPSGSSTPETTAPNIIGSQINQGGGGDNNFGGQGIGAFGNLDPNTKKTMQVEMADGKGGVVIKEVDTYLDAGGLRKTLDNKNPVNAGIDIKPMAVGILEALMGKKNDSEFDAEGKIYGTFNNPNYQDLSFLGKIKADYSRQKELKQLQKEFELQEQLKKQIAEEQKQQEAIKAATGNYTPGASNLTRGPSGGGLGLTQSQAQSVSQANKDAGYASFGGLKDGGLATMFKEKR